IPHPGPMSTVGASVAPSTGNQWARMVVPSNDVMSRSWVEPVTGAATTSVGRSGVHSRTTVVLDAADPSSREDESSVLVHAAPNSATTAATTATRTVRLI